MSMMTQFQNEKSKKCQYFCKVQRIILLSLTGYLQNMNMNILTSHVSKLCFCLFGFSMQVVSPEDTSKPEKCKGDFVKVMDGDCSSFKAETKYCGKQEPAPFISTGNKLCVKFFSDESQTAQGFSASYEAVDRPTNPGGSEGEGVVSSVYKNKPK